MERQIWKSMCTNTPWSYMIFWKLDKERNSMLMSYEEGYCDYINLLQDLCKTGNDCSRQEDETSSVFETSMFVDHGHSNKYPNRFTFGDQDVSCPQYQLGVGLLGKVVDNESNLWIYSDDIASMEFLSRLKYSDKWWLLPMKAGVKTTVLVPILPHGVLQVGSLEKVPENYQAVADVKHKLIDLIAMPYTLSSTPTENALLISSTQMPDKDESYVSTSYYKTIESKNLAEVQATTIDKFGNCDQFLSSFNGTLLQDVSMTSSFAPYNNLSSLVVDTSVEQDSTWKFNCQEERYDDEIFKDSSHGLYKNLLPELISITKNDGELGHNSLRMSEWSNREGDQEQLLEDVVTSCYRSIDDNIPSMRTNMSSLTPLDDNVHSLETRITYETLSLPTIDENTCAEFPTSPSSFESSMSAIVVDEWPVTCAYNMSNENADVLEVNQTEIPGSNHIQEQSELFLSAEKSDGSEQISYEENVLSGVCLSPLRQESTEWFDKGAEHEQLLDAVISSLYVNSDDSLSSWSGSTRSSLTSLEESSPSQVEISFSTSPILSKSESASIYEEHAKLPSKPHFVDFSSSSFKIHESSIVEREKLVKSDYDLSNESLKTLKFCKYVAGSEGDELLQDFKEIGDFVNVEKLDKSLQNLLETNMFEKQGDEEQLSEVVFTSLQNNLDDTISSRSMSSLNSFEDTSSIQMQISFDANTTDGMSKRCSIDKGFTSLSWNSNTDDEIFTSPFSFDIFEHEQPAKCATFGISNKSTKLATLKKSEARSKNFHKQRPRDRQLIQDRLKELREIVPNSEKCSIDGVLDQTIKHMMFLRRVTEQAGKVKKHTDKLMLYGNLKDTNVHTCDSMRAPSVEDSDGPCPVIVKDLDHPGQLLIQMLCNDDEVFFEMAEVMYELKLTILKGVMESCCNNWALFIVQANKGFNRLDIFWPLMRILQRNGSWTMNQLCP